MRLKCIKLAGFKSFVDPTTVDFPSNLCAVVGPNGCGKSNIIDAVRWVMGESSAKNLRGESMTDVIFNGSGGRKPVGQASIELVFDNSDGSLGGEYAGWAEIAIKRKVTRDAQNQYFLNGEKCRRRDITDIFLGTGLGPRSYAIIEQGTISKLIESKPEELRVFIEEAAGISKYKERRKDTESRMRRTGENLERLADIRDELERQLQHLHRQAAAAEKYTNLKEDERVYKAQLQALQWRDLDVAVKERATDISGFELDVEAAITKQTSLDTTVEKLFAQQGDARDTFNDVQGRFYNLGAEIARAEQSIAHQRDRNKQLHDDLDVVRQSCTQGEELLQEDVEKQEAWQEDLMDIEPELEMLAEAEESSQMILLDLEERMQGWQGNWDEFNANAAESRQKAEVQQSRIQQTETSLTRINERIQRFEDEMASLTAGPVEEEIAELQEQVAEIDMQLEEDQENLESQQLNIEETREASTEQMRRMDDLKTDLQTRRGRLSSLEALQQAALSKTNDKVVQWLADQGLAGNTLLAESLQVESGWEKAIETVLAQQLQSVCVQDIANYAASVAEVDAGSVLLIDSTALEYRGAVDLPTLFSKVSDNKPLSTLLAGIYIADNLDIALSKKSSLAANESIITSDGLWIGPNWLHRLEEDDAQAGMLKRKQEIEDLRAVITELEDGQQVLDEELNANREALGLAERDRDDAQRRFKENSQRHNALNSELSREKSRIEQILVRKNQISADLQEAKEQYQLEQETVAEARGTLEDAIESMDVDADKREDLIRERDNVRDELDRAKDRARTDKDRSHQLAMKDQSLRTQIANVAQSLERTRIQIQQMQQRREQLEGELAHLSGPDDNLASELEALLEKRLVVEGELTTARKRVESIEHEMRESERQRSVLQQATDGHRLKLEQARLAQQSFQVQRDNLHKQLKDAEFDLEIVIEHMPEEANEEDWKQELERIANRISRLGAINLAAIEEYKVASERKRYLDEQNADLEEALLTLENAIRKIDRETRLRFKETFDKVNEGLQELFPKIFGGGRAYLEMTGDDLLNTGIAIMAQPPGKRNSTIHLLSGGEKALTAIALVFSIFRLNPAPFCMLDEVDAPLDDANVARYARMVKEMSSQVQFIYITHNKIAMEMASQLLGVTMHEPGCSRMVSVDVEEAAELAAM
ncbi:MAG: chromosome segregation protein SMC [Pseudomonadales bacterium]|nr:chromosome segregation protein SMC [Pseudomonadales bacterium]